MKKLNVVLLAMLLSFSAFSQKKDVVDIAISSPDHTTLVAAVKAADLVATLKSEGPFTVFAPTNKAFDKLPEGTVATLLKPENKAQLAKILTYHVISGNLDAAAVMAALEDGNGEVVLTTVSGGKLTVSLEMDKVKLTDETGNSAFVTAVDLKGSNGVIHVIDGVVLPK
ncbi:MAG: fasciclin domain-containing protein [Bacteroidales bacterium]